MDNLAIIARIKILCKEKGISMAEFYKNAGVTSGGMSQWATGKTTPRMSTLGRIAEYLGSDVDYLVNGTKKEKATEDDLSLEQRELIFLFRNLSPEQQAKVLHDVKSLLFG